LDFYDFGIVLAFAIGCVVFVSIQAVALAFLVKWNAELRKEVEANRPPF
jgi:hypothetical protein